MALQDDTDLVLDHRAAQSRYDYFLMAVAGSAIALSVQRTTGELLAWSMIPLGIAVLLWGFSFFAGIRRQHSVNAVSALNLDLRQVRAGDHPIVGTDKHLV
ncbi:MAG: hypothetical protein JSU63_03835 [Phycisphaerales bacterium]|nr:MAG: hypothetical protein JSU63_03835 [Phycisphaerales bacterium]